MITETDLLFGKIGHAVILTMGLIYTIFSSEDDYREGF